MKLYYWSKEPLNEYHYIGIDKKLLSNWCNANYVPHISRRKKVKFEKLYARKQLEVVLRNSTDIYIFKVKLIKSHIYKLNYFVENEWLNAEYIGRGINYKFHPENKHWKDLIKEIRKKWRKKQLTPLQVVWIKIWIHLLHQTIYWQMH